MSFYYTSGELATQFGIPSRTVRRILRDRMRLYSSGRGYYLTPEQFEEFVEMASKKKDSSRSYVSSRSEEENDQYPALPLRRIRETDRVALRERVEYAEKRRQRLLAMIRDAGVQ